MSESDLVRAFLVAVPKLLPGAYIERRNVFRNAVLPSGHRISAGVEGQCDTFVVYRGRHVEAECKAPGGRLSAPQQRWKRRCAQLGIPHVVLASHRDESPEGTVARWVTAVRIAAECE